MTDSTVYIRDHTSLIELNNTLEYSADSMLKILESVNGYLEGVLKALEEQLKALEERLKAAEEALSVAESAYSSCLASQRWVDEDEDGNGGYYTPSCSSEESDVESCRQERDRCQEEYDKGKRIYDECEYEIRQYREPGGMVTPPPGGEKTLEYLAKDHTDAATKKMRDILEVVERYLKANMSIHGESFSTVISSESVATSDNPNASLTPEQKTERFKSGIAAVIRKQNESNYGSRQLADANRVIKCPRCHRPLVACICDVNTREREYTREQIIMINNDFSHSR